MAVAHSGKRRMVTSGNSHASTRTNGASLGEEASRLPMPEKRQRISELYKLSFRLHCMLGGHMLNDEEVFIMVILILGVLLLATAGAYKQLTKLTERLLA
ncbi:hypothetical protein Vretimale_17427 [Volvox reticuliferus]|uniref:Uncharacterized protein n=1 Tax=Volvox reticuliferus TaxID=1737510 RepID=A0A8J4GVR5_9CHLO|nr:hypothetical protein Vretifemale_9409 [Volvox reticuliferus]GIM14478.1 hypothetical protein Vretimale_17427 [Volvox reticuliferus]